MTASMSIYSTSLSSNQSTLASPRINAKSRENTSILIEKPLCLNDQNEIFIPDVQELECNRQKKGQNTVVKDIMSSIYWEKGRLDLKRKLLQQDVSSYLKSVSTDTKSS